MSGPSLAGIDAAIVAFEGDEERPDRWDVVAFRTERYPPEVRAALRSAIRTGTAATLCDLDFDLGARIGAAVRATIDASAVSSDEVRAVGSHGQTLWHRPPAGGERGATLQLGQPALIAEIAELPVVGDFRVRDLAVGGEGAPLTAHTDALMLRGDEPRAIQNIGGMANVTALPGLDDDAEPLAFDTGPGVALLDAAIERVTEGALAFDRDGEMARRGTIDGEALAEWLDDPYFEAPPPKSTGREYFSETRLVSWLERHSDLAPDDIAATLTELTAVTIARGYEWIGTKPDACYACGGGARNRTLVDRLRAALDPLPVHDLSELGLDPDAREAVAFALLARQHVLGFPANATWATGASDRRILGSLTPA
ncbi:MAG: anhydro-N-acetylmuramic acid kinase [Gemmatimonadetes bacterium]|nr:anhydro-N-acetylmuramic acid kinase [Gemmatimonadota bacterium]